MSLNPLALSELWQQRYEEAAAFFEEHHRLPKQRECAAGKWLAKQREKARVNALSAEQVRLLAQIPGFAVDQRGRGHQDHLAAVTAFSRKHARLPRISDPGMGAHAQWIKDVRTGKVTLTQEHQQQLDEMGFSASPTGDRQQDFIAHYTAYVAETGRKRVPVGYTSPDGYPLGKRCHRRRQIARAGELSAIHRAQLDAVGFPWGSGAGHSPS